VQKPFRKNAVLTGGIADVEHFNNESYPIADIFRIATVAVAGNKTLVDNSYVPTYTTSGSMPSTSYQAGTFVLNSKQ
jgi:hypothetical protein